MRGSPRILVVDDQEGIRRLLEETCTILGYEAETAASGKEALEKLEERSFALILIDMKMPGLNGLETLKKILALNNSVRTVLMTGYGESYLLEEALQLGVSDIIQKPFDLNEIKDLLERLSMDEVPNTQLLES